MDARPLTRVFPLVLGVALLGAAFAGLATATDRPAFCGSTCHEMQPFHAAWSKGGHQGVACVECHVDAGPVARLQHKFVALQEVASHIKGGVRFPLSTPVAVPDSRCVRCHDDIVVKQAGFSHAEHAKRGPCISCHADAGHSVTNTALRDAGVFNVAYRPTETSGTAKVGGGKDNLAGHKTVPCSRCHDMAATPCSACHVPAKGHEKRPSDCTVCHTTDVKFAFVHPNRSDCATCHEPKTAKHTWKGECTQCHVAAPGASWAFSHPASTACTSCHTAPAKHRSGSCTTCHSAGDSWSFRHPASSAGCASCHPRPSGHKSGSCVTCHRNVGKSWSFSHPGSSASCASCHPRPGGHKSGSCQTCHRNTGRNWSFTHTSSSRCSSCHRAPSNHFGTTCFSCHSPSRPWRSASFSHGRIPGGQHSYRSFACSKCHPSGYSSYFCTCHGNKTGPKDD